MKFIKNNPITNIVLLLAAINLYFGSIYHFEEPPRWKSIFYSDSEGYYIYLPAVFIYDGFVDVPLFYGQKQDGEKVFTKYTCGVAMMESPFFMAAHVYSKITGNPPSGYTAVYAFAILLSATFYGCWGLYLLGNLLKKRFGPLAAVLSIAVLYLGTNLMYYMMKEPGMSHVYSFFLFAAFLSLFSRYLKKTNVSRALLLGLVFGLIILIRPTNIIIALILPLWDVVSIDELKSRFRFFWRYTLLMVLMCAIPIVVFIPQFMYWEYMTGDFIIYSYTNEGFKYWNAPKILKVLFDVQNGWLIYSPAMVFSLVGLAFMLKNKIANAFLILFIFGIATYIFGSWWAWWFGGAYGHRCYVEFLAVMAIPLAYFFQILRKKRPWVMATVFILIAVFCYYNLGLTYWYTYTAPWDGAQWTWEKFGSIVQRLF